MSVESPSPAEAATKTLLKIERVYVAGASCDLDRAERWINLLAVAGVEVTSPWLDVIRARQDGDANPRGAEHYDVRKDVSHQNLKAIDSSQLLWFLVPAPPDETRGAWYEAGYAQKGGRVVFYSGTDSSRSVFSALGREFVDDVTAFAVICRLVREGAWV